MSTVENRESEGESLGEIDLGEMSGGNTSRQIVHTVIGDEQEGRNIQIGEANKLDGESNYQVWKVKIKAIFKRESLWEIVQSKVIPESYPSNIGGSSVTERKLRVMKANAYSAIVMSVKDKLLRIIEDLDDPADQWQKLADKFQSGDTSQLLMVLAQLHSMRMKEGGSVEEYIANAEELRSQMARMGENVLDTTLVQLVLNGLPRSFDNSISSISNLDVLPSFDRVSAKLLTEAHRMQQRSIQLGEEDQEALVAQYGKMKIRTAGASTRDKKTLEKIPDSKGRRPIICYTCGKSGHIARNCVDSKYRPQEGQERTVNAVVEEEEYEELEASIAEITKNSR
jgi:hypothetical protein